MGARRRVFPEAFRREPARSTADGVRSVPHFVFSGRITINGGGSEDQIASAISEAARAAASA
jgi:predicted DsbA family dithiol-disulfide isomerase